MICSVCSFDVFEHKDVLWESLIREWQLAPHEVEYMNKQQGYSCTQCYANLRSMALAKGITSSYQFNGDLSQFVESKLANSLKVLEINPAGSLTPTLNKMKCHQLISYPEIDMMQMEIEDNAYDLVIHSDTLEHIENPVIALSECRRILKDDGLCIFTVPIVVDRLSRSRAGLPDSFHGVADTAKDDFIVHTEFGMDVWQYVLKAGFSQFTFHCIDYPAGLSIVAIP